MNTLQLADRETRAGRYLKALELLESKSEPVEISTHGDYWLGMVALQTARAKLHLRDSKAVIDSLDLISQDLIKANPKISSEYHLITGIIYRREAYKLFKDGQSVDAMKIAEKSIESFYQSGSAALLALDGKLQYTSTLNRLYARGLLLLISGAKSDDWLPLFTESVKAEFYSRIYTPIISHDDLSGLTIVIDLALGAKISPMNVYLLSEDDNEYKRACTAIFGHDCKSWPELIVNTVRKSGNIKAEVIATILRLGAKIIIGSISEFASTNLPKEVAFHMHNCILSLENQPNTKELVSSLADLINLFPNEVVRWLIRPRLMR